MSFNKNSNQKGFTIVELLIVIVVIGILAAITIVAYNSIQNRGKIASAQAAANTVIKKAEAANAIASSYPVDIAGFAAQSDSSLAGSGITLGSVATVPAKPATVQYFACSATSGAGAKVQYWDFTANAASTAVTIGGACTTYSTTALSQAY